MTKPEKPEVLRYKRENGTYTDEQYPANRKTQPEEREKIEKVVTGRVTQKKKSLGKRFSENFLADDTQSVGSYVLWDILVPAAKSLVSDMISGGVEMLLFGERRGSRTRRDRDRSYVSYGSYYRGDTRERERRPDISRQGRARHDFDEIVLETRGEAEEVLSRLVDLSIDYGQATVADLYDLVGITGSYTDAKYGWTDLRSASVHRTRGGYILDLPKTEVVD